MGIHLLTMPQVWRSGCSGLLLKEGADFGILNNAGKTVQDEACFNTTKNCEEQMVKDQFKSHGEQGCSDHLTMVD